VHRKLKEIAQNAGSTLSEALGSLMVEKEDLTGGNIDQKQVTTGKFLPQNEKSKKTDQKPEVNSMSSEEIEAKARELVQQKENSEAIKALRKDVETMNKRQDSLCKQFPEFCARLEKAVEASKQQPGVGGTHHPNLLELLHCAGAGNEDNCFEGLCEMMPVNLKTRLLKAFCQDGQCQAALAEEGLEGKVEKKYRGMLGG